MPNLIPASQPHCCLNVACAFGHFGRWYPSCCWLSFGVVSFVCREATVLDVALHQSFFLPPPIPKPKLKLGGVIDGNGGCSKSSPIHVDRLGRTALKEGGSKGEQVLPIFSTAVKLLAIARLNHIPLTGCLRRQWYSHKPNQQCSATLEGSTASRYSAVVADVASL